MKVFDTERLELRHLCEDDASFILGLVNDRDYVRYIGDRGVKSIDGARDYIVNGPMASYQERGFGLYLVQLKSASTPIGTCGLLKREGLDDVDLGFAFMPQYRVQGYAIEAAEATLNYAAEVLGLKRVVAITAIDNARSIRLLKRLGFEFERHTKLRHDAEKLNLFGVQL